jgi:hypothetical protein
MTKRPTIDLRELTTGPAVPMAEAQQRVATTTPPAHPLPKSITRQAEVSPVLGDTLNFKVTAAFRKRFKGRAVGADLKLNELLSEALDAWEEKRGLKK